MGYLFVICFWVGIYLLKPEYAGDLKARAIAYWGRGKSELSNSAPVKFVKNIKASARKDALSSELAECLAYIKNVVILGGGGSISAQKLLEDLADFSKELRPCFNSMARFISSNEKESASECLGDYIGTNIAQDVGIFLAGWEDLPPEDILEMVDAYQSSLREERITARKRKDETISDLVFFPVVINCIVVLLNFIYVAYFIEQQETLSILF